MLNTFKSIISGNNKIESLPVEVKTGEQVVVEKFSQFLSELKLNPDIPKKVIEAYNNIESFVKEIKFNDLTIEDQSLIRNILEIDTKYILDVYLSIPKAHAVSVVLENGKTAKETLIENSHNLHKKINTVWTEALDKKTKELLMKEKIVRKVEKKKDFFDL